MIQEVWSRIIVNPARAGMIPTLLPAPLLPARKPRASGDDPQTLEGEVLAVQVNPARAGMIPQPQGGHRTSLRKPRASGDDPNLEQDY